MNKKGAIEIQFNWIYVAIAGVVILAIFINIAGGIRKGSKEELALEALNYFDEIFTSLQGSEKSEHTITLPGLGIDVDSEAENCNFYSISDSNIGRRSTEYLPVFSPDHIQTQILSYSRGWDIPFRTTYFLYMTSPDVLYAYVGSNTGLSGLRDAMPDHVTEEQIANVNNVKNNNYYKIKFVSFESLAGETVSNSIGKMKDGDVGGVSFNTNDEVEFFEKDNDELVSTGTSYYIDEPTMIAAVYAENIGSYECNLKKAILRANKISEVLIKRIEMIESAHLLPHCQDDLSDYGVAKTYLTSLRSATAQQDITSAKMNQIKGIKNSLVELNTELNKQSCPTVY